MADCCPSARVATRSTFIDVVDQQVRPVQLSAELAGNLLVTKRFNQWVGVGLACRLALVSRR
jgi:hypothetical protein